MFSTKTGIPDIAVASIMAMLGLSGGWQIVRQAKAELNSDVASEKTCSPLL